MMIRLNQKNQELLRQKAIEINKILVKNSKQPLRDSQIMSKIITLGLKNTKWANDGEIYLDE